MFFSNFKNFLFLFSTTFFCNLFFSCNTIISTGCTCSIYILICCFFLFYNFINISSVNYFSGFIFKYNYIITSDTLILSKLTEIHYICIGHLNFG